MSTAGNSHSLLPSLKNIHFICLPFWKSLWGWHRSANLQSQSPSTGTLRQQQQQLVEANNIQSVCLVSVLCCCLQGSQQSRTRTQLLRRPAVPSAVRPHLFLLESAVDWRRNHRDTAESMIWQSPFGTSVLLLLLATWSTHNRHIVLSTHKPNCAPSSLPFHLKLNLQSCQKALHQQLL